MKTITVVAAAIRNSRGEIFATQRGYGEFKDWWELPGGKAEPGETMEQALRREIMEELLRSVLMVSSPLSTMTILRFILRCIATGAASCRAVWNSKSTRRQSGLLRMNWIL